MLICLDEKTAVNTPEGGGEISAGVVEMVSDGNDVPPRHRTTFSGVLSTMLCRLIRADTE